MPRQKGCKDLIQMPDELKLKKVLGVRLTERDTQRLEQVASENGQTAIELTRALIVNHLNSLV